MKCPYCSTDVNQVNETLYHCSFCEMDLDIEKLKSEEKRPEFYSITQAVFDKHIHFPTSVLSTYHTYNLLELLYYARKERSTEYDLLRSLNNVVKQGYEDFKTPAAEQGQNYDYFTRKVWVIENLLLERTGYIPKRITLQFLYDYKEKCLESQKKKMKISNNSQK